MSWYGPTTCRSCGEPCVWLTTRAGKRILVEADENGDFPEEHETFDATLHTAHWSACPEAERWRKQDPPPDEGPDLFGRRSV